jgi:hypothetical protein
MDRKIKTQELLDNGFREVISSYNNKPVFVGSHALYYYEADFLFLKRLTGRNIMIDNVEYNIELHFKLEGVPAGIYGKE